MKNWISILLILNLFILPTTAKADVAGLKPCKDSKEFQRRLDQSVKKLESRVKNTMPVAHLHLHYKNKLKKRKTVLTDMEKQAFFAEQMDYRI